MDLEKILKVANDLGHLLQQNEIVQRMQDLARKLEADEEARNLLEEYGARAEMMHIKRSTGKPIEVQEKKDLVALEEKVQGHSLLTEFLATQAYYMQLMAQVNETISNPTGEPPKASNIVLPGEGSRIFVP